MKRNGTPQTHLTLHPELNILIIALWGIAAIVVGILLQPVPVFSLLVGAIAGIIIGFLQQRSIKKKLENFAHADTALEVRKVLASSREGRLAIAIQWGAMLLLIIVGVPFSLVGFELVRSIFAGYLALMFCRELLTFPATLWISRVKMKRE